MANRSRRGLSRLSHRGGDLRSLRGWLCHKGRSKFKCDTNVHCVSDKQYMKYSTDNHLTHMKVFFFKCRPRPTVVYIIVIYRQPCALYISWYTVHHPSWEEFTVLGQGGYSCFQGVNILPYGWLHKLLRSRLLSLSKI